MALRYWLSKYHFLGEGVLLNSVMDIHCSTVEGGGRPKSDGCRCEGRGSQKFSLCRGHK